MGVLKKLLGMEKMDGIEHNHLELYKDDITTLLRIEHENQILLKKIREKLLEIYKDIMYDPRLKTDRVKKIISELEYHLGMKEKKLVPETSAQMQDEKEVLILLNTVQGIIEAEKGRYRRAA